jgi:Leucine-rich repeat (LRR) protein
LACGSQIGTTGRRRSTGSSRPQTPESSCGDSTRRFKCPEALVADLSPLANLTSLQWLSLSGAQVTDLSPLFNLTALQFVVLSAGTITEAQADELRRALPNAEVVRY